MIDPLFIGLDAVGNAWGAYKDYSGTNASPGIKVEGMVFQTFVDTGIDIFVTGVASRVAASAAGGPETPLGYGAGVGGARRRRVRRLTH